MITRPTTLVLGAGASVPYGFPTGDGLRHLIVDRLAGPGSTDHQAIKAAGCLTDTIAAFREAFLRSQIHSIDAFLEDQPQFLHVGRLAIAAVLIPFELEEKVLDTGPKRTGWYDLLFQAMRPTADIVQNKLSIVTFNYDRSLEFALHQHVKFALAEGGRTSGLLDAKAAEIVRQIPIVHVYGQMAPLPWQGAVGSVRGYVPDSDPRKIIAAAEGIRLAVIRAGEPASSEVQRAQELIRAAKRVLYLGFGFDDTNMARLDVRAPSNFVAPNVTATGLGFGPAVQRRIFKKWKVRIKDCDVRTFLKEHVRLDEG